MAKRRGFFKGSKRSRSDAVKRLKGLHKLGKLAHISWGKAEQETFCPVAAIAQERQKNKAYGRYAAIVNTRTKFAEFFISVYDGLPKEKAQEFAIKLHAKMSLNLEPALAELEFKYLVLMDRKYGAVRFTKRLPLQNMIKELAELIKRKIRDETSAKEDWRNLRKKIGHISFRLSSGHDSRERRRSWMVSRMVGALAAKDSPLIYICGEGGYLKDEKRAFADMLIKAVTNGKKHTKH